MADLTTTLDVDDARPGLVGAVDAGARVVVTSLGLAGDAGISRATTLLALGGGSALADLPGVLGARTVLRRAPVATVTDANGFYVFTNVADSGTPYNISVLTSDGDWPAGLPTTPTYDAVHSSISGPPSRRWATGAGPSPC